MFAPLADARLKIVSSGRASVPRRYWTFKKVIWRKVKALMAAAFSKIQPNLNLSMAAVFSYIHEEGLTYVLGLSVCASADVEYCIL